MSLRSAIVLGLLLAGTAVTAAGADVFLWEPPFQVSHTDSGVALEGLTLGRDLPGDGPRMHVLLGIRKSISYPYAQNGYHMPVGSTMDWSAAWEDSLHRVTWDSDTTNTLGWVSTDFHMAVDADDNVHVIYEDFESSPSLVAAYRTRFGGHWNGADSVNSAVHLLSAIHECTTGSPTLFLEERGAAGVTDDWLHVSFNSRVHPDTCGDGGWISYNRRLVTSDDSTGWEAPARLTDYFSEQLLNDTGRAPAQARRSSWTRTERSTSSDGNAP
jgi:hypothetical protein